MKSSASAGAVVLQLLCECIRQPSKAAHSHPHIEVLPFNVGRADMLAVRVAFYRHLRARELAGDTSAQKRELPNNCANNPLNGNFGGRMDLYENRSLHLE